MVLETDFDGWVFVQIYQNNIHELQKSTRGELE